MRRPHPGEVGRLSTPGRLGADLPVFVYGTLRRGGRYHAARLEGRVTAVRPAVLRGAVMWDDHGRFPYVALGRDGVVVGELIDLDASQRVATMRDLDHLEGYDPAGGDDQHFVRVVHEVEAGEERVEAWVYVVAPALADDVAADLPVVASGDWAEVDPAVADHQT